MNADCPKPTVLIVEDEEGPRNALRVILRPFYQLFAAESCQEALHILRRHPVDLVTLDMKLPDGQGLDLLRSIKRERSDAEVIIITGYGKLKSSQEALRHGAIGYLLKPFNVRELITLLNLALEKKQRLDYLRQFLRSVKASWAVERGAAGTWARLAAGYYSIPRSQRVVEPRDGTFDEYFPLLSDLFEAISLEFLAHATRVRGYALLMAKPLNLSPAEQQAVSIGSFLHDIGRIRREKGRLATELAEDSDDRHPDVGARMILPFPIPREAAQIIAYHHERFDGSGYPNGLKGQKIPLMARVVGIAEAFDHLTVVTNDAGPLSVGAAREVILGQAGTGFDPDLAQIFIEQVGDSGNAELTPASH